MRPASSRLAVLAALALLLAGCGQRGPLYLPGQTPPKKRLSQVAPPPASAVLPPFVPNAFGTLS